MKGKKLTIIFQNEKGEILPINDIECFTIRLALIPAVGDILIFENYDESIEPDFEFIEPFLKKRLPDHSERAYKFRISKREIYRVGSRSWVNVYAQYLSDQTRS